MLGKRAMALAVAGALLLPAAAQAATKTVSMGVPASSAKKFQAYSTEVQDFFPVKTTIRVGDTVSFVPVGFHNAEILPKGQAATPTLLPNGQKASGAADSAGAPFWFNGLDLFGFNPALLQSSYGKRLAYDGTKSIQSGLPLGPKLKPMRVKFKKAGTVSYLCNLHPGMTGTIRVRAKGAKIPSKKADARAVKKQLARALKTTKALQKRSVPANTVHVGEAGANGVEYFGFLPGSITVPVGTTVKFQMTDGSREIHTATAGPGDPAKEPASYLGKLAASFEAPSINPAAMYPSDAPGAPASLTSTSHGNGFWNSGVIDANPSPLPADNSVKFAAAGTFTFYCLVHPSMKGTVKVQ